MHRTLLPQLCHFHCIRPQGHFSLLVGPINRIQGGWVSLPLLLFSFAFLRLERLSQDPNFLSNNQMREEGWWPLCFMWILFDFYGEIVMLFVELFMFLDLKSHYFFVRWSQPKHSSWRFSCATDWFSHRRHSGSALLSVWPSCVIWFLIVASSRLDSHPDFFFLLESSVSSHFQLPHVRLIYPGYHRPPVTTQNS
jgi:hypothetical protein